MYKKLQACHENTGTVFFWKVFELFLKLEIRDPKEAPLKDSYTNNTNILLYIYFYNVSNSYVLTPFIQYYPRNLFPKIQLNSFYFLPNPNQKRKYKIKEKTQERKKKKKECTMEELFIGHLLSQLLNFENKLPVHRIQNPSVCNRVLSIFLIIFS